MGGRRRWRKILYEKQDYPDNYMDRRQFLNGLRKNCELNPVHVGVLSGSQTRLDSNLGTTLVITFIDNPILPLQCTFTLTLFRS